MSESQQHRVVVVGADGQPVGEMEVPAEVVADTDGDEGGDPTGQISQPAKVMRIGTMIKQLLEEVGPHRWTRPAAPGCGRSTRPRSRSWRTACPPSCARSSIG